MDAFKTSILFARQGRKDIPQKTESQETLPVSCEGANKKLRRRKLSFS